MLQHLLRRLVFDVPILNEFAKMPLKVRTGPLEPALPWGLWAPVSPTAQPSEPTECEGSVPTGTSLAFSLGY